MVAQFVAASATNGYLPQATGQVIAFVRRPEEFIINKMVSLVPCPNPTGLYNRLDRDNGVRVKNIDQFVWSDGADFPSGQYFTSRFTTKEFRTQRHAIPWELGGQAVDNATLWNPKLTHMMEAVSDLMTLRTNRVYTVLETSGNWDGNTASATSLGGGKWDAGTSTAPYFKKGLLAAAVGVHLGTNAKVRINDMLLILNPYDAIKIASSAEITDYMKSSVHSRMMLEDPFGAVNEQWGLPRFYQGVEIIVDTTPKVTEVMNATGVEATTNRVFAKVSDTAILLSRPGSLDSELSQKSFSTMQIFYYDKVGLMQVKGMYDGWSEKWKGGVIDQTAEILAAPMSGYLITDIMT